MNKTVSIALAGFSFIIEEYAYIKLNNYLQALGKSLSEEEKEEVMYDIEIRITEIFKSSMGKRDVVNLDDVEKVIAQIGTPEVIEEQEEAYYSENTQKKNHKSSYSTEKRQLFRDPEKAKIAGVCAGLAYYVGVDISVMRGIWAVFLILGIFSAGISATLITILYAIMWGGIPKAQTASDFLKMKGKPADFGNIKEESIRFANQSGQKVEQFYQQNKTVIERVVGSSLSILGYFFASLFAVLAFIFLAIIFIGLFVTEYSWNINGVNMLEFNYNEEQLISLKVILSIFLLILASAFGSLSVKLFFPKTKIRYMGLVIGLLFAILLGVSAYFGTQVSTQEMFYSGSNQDEENIVISAPTNTLELGIKKIIIPENFKAYGYSIYSDKKTVFEKDYTPDVYITRKIGIKTPYLVIKKTGDGYNIPIRFKVPVEVRDGMILFPNYINYSYEHRFRDYEVSYELVIPQYMNIKDLSHGQLDIERQDDDEDIDDVIEDITESLDDKDFIRGKKAEINITTPTDTIMIKRK